MATVCRKQQKTPVPNGFVVPASPPAVTWVPSLAEGGAWSRAEEAVW